MLGNVHAPAAEEQGMRVVWIMIALGVVMFVAQLCAAYFLGIAGDSTNSFMAISEVTKANKFQNPLFFSDQELTLQ